jgi:cytochrome b561
MSLHGGRYDPVTRRLHWASAILALVTIMLAWNLLAAPRHDATRGWLITLHASFGMAILVLMLFWAGWRLRHRAPPLRPMLSRVEVVLARVTQAAIFLVFVVMPISGFVSLAAAGKSVSLFGIVPVPPLVPESGRLSQAAIALHLLGEFLIYGLVGLHIAAALRHGVLRRDGILDKMLPPRS